MRELEQNIEEETLASAPPLSRVQSGWEAGDVSSQAGARAHEEGEDDAGRLVPAPQEVGSAEGVVLDEEYASDRVDAYPAVNQSLARLEMSTLEVKLHLDSIDQRISRIEPRLEQMRAAEGVPASAETEAGSPAAEPPLRAMAEKPSMPTAERRRRAQGVPVERRRPPYADVAEVEEREPIDMRAWLRTRRAWAPVAAMGLVGILGVILWGSNRHPLPPKSTVGAVDAGGVLGESARGPQKSSADIPWVSGTGARAEPGARGSVARPNSVVVEQGVVVPMGSGAAAIAAQPQGTAKQDAVPPVPSDKVSASPGADVDQPESEPDAAPMAAPGSRPAASGRIIPPPTSRVQVSSGVMAGNLVYSRQPAYPHGIAGLFHTEGRVVMQAIISKRGHVENLRVISGHYMLRGAAKDAVRTWRYRPYSINGAPVEVATIISVEFRR